MKIRHALTGLVAAASIGGLVFWFSRSPPVEVTVIAVEKGSVERTIANTRSGTVKACQRAKLSLAIGGQIALLNVQEGDRVKSGALLAELWNEDLRARTQQAVLAAESAHQEHDAICIRARNSRREADRLSRLVNKQLISEETAEQALAQANAAGASCAAAKAREQEATAAIAVAKTQMEKTRLYAPFAGIVAEVRGEVGEYTTPSPPGVATPPVIDLITDDCHYVEAPIDEVDAAALALHYPVRISFDAYPDQTFPGRIKRIATYVLDTEKQARTVALEAVLIEQPGRPSPPLLAGYSADIEVVLESRDATLRIPTEALLEQRYVLVFHPGSALEKRAVEVGLSNWRYTEILAGLTDAERVVTSLGREGVEAGAQAVLE